MKSIFLLFASIAAKNRANLPYYDVIDGIRCKKSDWDSKAVARPFLETHSGSVKGKHNCKVCWRRIAKLFPIIFYSHIKFQVNRRYADPKIEANTKGPMKFEGDSFWHVPYDTDLISFFSTSNRLYFVNFKSVVDVWAWRGDKRPPADK